MNRRRIFKSILGLFAAPFVAKAVEKPAPYAVTPEQGRRLFRAVAEKRARHQAILDGNPPYDRDAVSNFDFQKQFESYYAAFQDGAGRSWDAEMRERYLKGVIP